MAMKTTSARWAVACVLSAGLLAAASAEAAYTADEEIEFASKLISFSPSFSDYAQKVVDSLVSRDPSQKDRSQVIQGELYIKRKELAKAQELVDSLGVTNPKAQAIMLKLALAYYNTGEQQKAVDLLDNFFKACGGQMPDDPDVARSFQDAAFIFARIREEGGDWAGAASCYKLLADTSKDKGLEREMRVKEADSWIKAADATGGEEREKALGTVEALCKQIVWGGLDIPFVKAVVIQAKAKMLRGDANGARETLQDYMATIKQVDEVIKENGLPMSESPMSGARSLLGRLLKSEAEQLEGAGDKAGALAKYAEALGEYYNVFVKYGQGPDGPAAGMESKAIKEILETRFGKTVQIELPAEMAAQAAGTEFMMADQLFRKKDWAEAEKEYRRVLKQFPESGDLSAKAVANLLQCYIRMDNPLYAKATADYLAERLGKKSALAAKGVLAAGEIYRKDKGDDGMRDWMFETYLKRCPDDDQAGTILFFLANLAEQAGDADKANQYLGKIITEHQQDQYYPKALSKQAWTAYAAHDFEGAKKGLMSFIKETQGQTTPMRAQAMFALADCMRRTGGEAGAIKVFDQLVGSLSGEAGKRWGGNQAEHDKNAKLLEQALYFRAFTLSGMEGDEQRRAGVAQFQEFVKNYPQSAMAPKALKTMGSAQMALKDPAANDTYARLAKEYPDTDEGKNAQYTRISGALELKQYDQAREAARAMLQNAGSFKTTEFLRVGNELLEHELYPEAAAAFEQVRKGTDERGQLEHALFGLGKAKHGTGDENGAVEAMNELMERWPKSALFYDAKFVLAEANLKLGEADAAKDALNSILRYADKPEVNNEASMLMAQVQKNEGDLAGAAQTYQRLEYLNLLNMPTEKERAQMKKALLEAMALEEEMKDDARLQETADAFLEHFPMAAEVGTVRSKRSAAALRLSAAVASADDAGGADAGAAE
jgi:outer membrane protein assembly factor BamD (BamD/ComL family)